MRRNVYVGSAWPYPNGKLHLGHIAGLVPADVIARYHRLRGDRVLWTSGSDCHGTPITERARKEGVAPRDVAGRFHAGFIRTFDRLGFSYDLYGATMEPWHVQAVQESFLELHRKRLIVEGEELAAHCDACRDRRADREIGGTCPACHSAGARGDQCDACGRVLAPNELLSPVCRACGGAIRFERSRELFFDLPAFEPLLRDWVGRQSHWRVNAKGWTDGWLKEGLKRRTVTRAIDWGIPVPLPGWEDRRIYVWFEAVHGYLTASREWARRQGDPDAWKPFWTMTDPRALAYYVVGKDNIPFHTLLWPAVLMGLGLALPWQIVSSEYLTFGDAKLSKSTGTAITADKALDAYDPDALRWFLVAHGPERQDTPFTWERFVSVANADLANTYSNLVHRLLSFVARTYGGCLPDAKPFGERADALLEMVDRSFDEIGTLIERTELREAAARVLALAQVTNEFVSHEAPWVQIRTNASRAASAVSVALRVIAALAVLTQPFMPFQAQRLARLLAPAAADGEAAFSRWEAPTLKPGVRLAPPEPLFLRISAPSA